MHEGHLSPNPRHISPRDPGPRQTPPSPPPHPGPRRLHPRPPTAAAILIFTPPWHSRPHLNPLLMVEALEGPGSPAPICLLPSCRSMMGVAAAGLVWVGVRMGGACRPPSCWPPRCCQCPHSVVAGHRTARLLLAGRPHRPQGHLRHRHRPCRWPGRSRA